MCSSRRIKPLFDFDIFRIGVVTGYREAMPNLLNQFSLKRLPCSFMSCDFMSCYMYFIILQFHLLSFGPSFSRPAISCPAHWSVNFMSCCFMPCKLIRQFHVRHFHVQHFQRPPHSSCFKIFEQYRLSASFLANRTISSMTGYWHDNVVCVSVHPSVCL